MIIFIDGVRKLLAIGLFMTDLLHTVPFDFLGSISIFSCFVVSAAVLPWILHGVIGVSRLSSALEKVAVDRWMLLMHILRVINGPALNFIDSIEWGLEWRLLIV